MTKEERKEYYQKNKEKLCEQSRKYNSLHKEEVSRKQKLRRIHKREEYKIRDHQYYLNHKQEKLQWQKDYAKEHLIERRITNLRWAHNNKHKIKAYQATSEFKQLRRKRLKTRYNTDANYRFEIKLRGRIRKALINQNVVKAFLFNELLGCSIDYLKRHLESQFQEGMSWDNYGSKGWHIDHIKPCASFTLSDPEQQKECFNWKNLQPLWWKMNLIKGKSYKGTLAQVRKEVPKPTKIIKSKKQKRLDKIRREEENERS